MFDRLARSWALVKASAAVLRADKELLVFPIVSAIASVLVVVTFAVPMVLTVVLAPHGEDAGPFAPLVWLLGFAFYVVQYFVIFFCNSALVGAALIRLRGGDPTVRDGFRIAASRVGPILGYAAVAATVGLILRALSQRSGLLGRVVVSLVGLAWNLATYLVVPVLVVEGVGPVEAVKRSSAYLKKTWGEQIIGNVGIGAVTGLAVFGTLGVGIVLIVAAVATESVVAIGIAAGLLVLALIVIGLVSAALGGVYAAAVYRYAAEGQTGMFFGADMVRDAFRQK
jgi:hypothetical protein